MKIKSRYAKTKIVKFFINSSFFRNSIYALLLIITVVWQNYNKEGYYHWFINNLIETNFNFIYAHDNNLTFDQKNEIKHGRTYFFLNLVKQSTPEDAVILFPEAHVFRDPSNQVEFNNLMNRKGYVTYFLYPRQIVYESEKDKTKMYKKITHVAIVNNWGYDKLRYDIAEKIPYSVLPINKQN